MEDRCQGRRLGGLLLASLFPRTPSIHFSQGSHRTPPPPAPSPGPSTSAPIPQKAGLAQEPPEQDLDRWHTPAGTPLTMTTRWFPAFTPLDSSPWGEPTGGSTWGPRASVRGGAAHQSCTAAAGVGAARVVPGPWGSRSGVRGRQLSGRSSRSDPELLVGPSPQGPAEKAGLEICRPSWRPGGRAPALGCPVGTQAQEARGTLLPASRDRAFVGDAELAA